jgi:hypothetical protein
LDPSHKSRKDAARLKERLRGIHGHPIAFFAVFETQGRGSEHIHYAVWGGIPPTLLQRISHIQSLAELAADAFDSIIKCELPLSTHINGLSRKLQIEEAPRLALTIGPIPQDASSSRNFEERVNNIVSCVQDHFKHCLTCHKGNVGKIKCRLCLPRVFKNRTGPLELQVNEDTSIHVSEIISSPMNTSVEYNVKNGSPFPDRDLRLIVWDIQRSEFQDTEKTQLKTEIDKITTDWPRNMLHPSIGNITEYSPTLTATLASNTCTSLLGDYTQAMGAIIYMIKYMSKDAAELSHSLSSIVDAFKHIQKYPSTAGDAGTVSRTARYYVTHCLNRISGYGEYSQSIVSATLLGYNSYICSHPFSYCFFTKAASHIINNRIIYIQDSNVHEFENDDINEYENDDTNECSSSDYSSSDNTNTKKL